MASKLLAGAILNKESTGAVSIENTQRNSLMASTKEQMNLLEAKIFNSVTLL